MRMLFSIVAAAALLAVPLAAHAAKTAKTLTYHTSYQQTQPLASAGQYTGRMTLHFYADGTVNGTYRDEYEGGFESVSGGLTGDRLWLSFGSRGRHQFNGTIGKGGVISGSLTNWRGPKVYAFKAVPSTS
ncbi:MAG TPA: hypothetical protein VJP85_03520 [Candidatus Baltobacteraceae bacterium]|nr:hypothetical protein [Candidatus Baltobacteraceae bacterium]